jgi:hypothetical protein
MTIPRGSALLQPTDDDSPTGESHSGRPKAAAVDLAEQADELVERLDELPAADRT